MARTHSSYTASPTRTRSPQRSQAPRGSSEDGSQYEMDLDALGLNSTFESTALEGSYEPHVDRIDTSEVEGPEDFTMNMTYWMTTDLLPTHVRSRKETQRRASRPEASKELQKHELGDDAAAANASTASPTVRVHGTTASREYSTPASERSMENEEKVRSFLSALPDTELDHVLASSPLRVPRQSMLQIPRASPPKARSLQATVEEDHDTPRKPTQQTVIRHPSPTAHDERETGSPRVADLQSQLDQQALASSTRITELETILSYTRSELDAARNDNYKHKDNAAQLERSLKEQQGKQDAAEVSTESRLRQLEQKLQEDHAKAQQAQREDFERQLRRLEESEREARELAATRTHELHSVQTILSQLELSREQQGHQTNDPDSRQNFQAEQNEERAELQNKLTLLQTRADTLQLDLAHATAEAKVARDESMARDAAHAASKIDAIQQRSHISTLQTQLQDTRFSLECAQADIAAKAQLFHTNIELNANLRILRNEIEAQRAALTASKLERSSPARDEQLQPQLAAKDEIIAQHVLERDGLERQLSTAQGRISSLESSLSTLRAQLAEAHRESGSAHTDVERLSQDLQDVNERLIDTRAQTERRILEMEKKLAKTKDLKSEAESRFRELKSQHDDLVEGHDAMLEDVRDKAEDAVRKTGALLAQERKETSRLKKDIERLQTELEDVRTENEHYAALAPDTDSDDTTTPLASPVQTNDAKDKEIATLRSIIKTQLADNKTLKSSHATALSALTTEISTLQTRLDTQAADHAAINAAMDEQLSTLLSKLMKERARTVVGKRDGQWEEVQRSAKEEKEILGKVLMRQWGREELGAGVGGEKGGQVYGYKFVKRER